MATHKRIIDDAHDGDVPSSAKQAQRTQAACLKDFLDAEARALCTYYEINEFLPLLLSNSDDVRAQTWNCVINRVAAQKRMAVLALSLAKHPVAFQQHYDQLMATPTSTWSSAQLELFKEAIACEMVEIDDTAFLAHFCDILKLLQKEESLLLLLIDAGRITLLEEALQMGYCWKQRDMEVLAKATGCMLSSDQLVTVVKAFVRMYQQHPGEFPPESVLKKISASLLKLPYPAVHHAWRQTRYVEKLAEWPAPADKDDYSFPQSKVLDVDFIRKCLDTGAIVGYSSTLVKHWITEATEKENGSAVDMLAMFVTFSPAYGSYIAQRVASHPRGAQIVKGWPVGPTYLDCPREWVMRNCEAFLDDVLVEIVKRMPRMVDFTTLSTSQLRLLAGVVKQNDQCDVNSAQFDPSVAVCMARDKEAFSTFLSHVDDHAKWINFIGSMTFDFVLKKMDRVVLENLWSAPEFRQAMLREGNIPEIRYELQRGFFPFALLVQYGNVEEVARACDLTKIFDHRRAHYIAKEEWVLNHWKELGQLDSCLRLAVDSKCDVDVAEALLTAGAKDIAPDGSDRSIFARCREDVGIVTALVKHGIHPSPNMLTPMFSRPCLEALIEQLPYPPSREALCSWVRVPDSLPAFKAVVEKHGKDVLFPELVAVARATAKPTEVEVLAWLLKQFKNHELQDYTRHACDFHSSWFCG